MPCELFYEQGRLWERLTSCQVLGSTLAILPNVRAHQAAQPLLNVRRCVGFGQQEIPKSEAPNTHGIVGLVMRRRDYQLRNPGRDCLGLFQFRRGVPKPQRTAKLR